MQQIILSGLKVDTLIGVYDWERTQQTTLLLDVTVDADLSEAMQSDDVTQTIDYAKLADCLKATASEQTFELLEALGACLMQAAFDRFPIQRMRLAITKPNILPDVDTVTVVFTRSRDL
ncbi:dihydroneopterin aldolase [Alteromonas sp. C1M14]|uniref:dihydroneopterin aldolase n=1 Tax=Alteromonas sp. C1M14 TaxID=2841567 RepID=UPI001C0A3A92|nr:dihydroneopterin aldolase [Alteromonas sp. C1M14]MBU2977623.1 dihydroneopterin aldolase [Alteromonas sp. C1M14]